MAEKLTVIPIITATRFPIAVQREESDKDFNDEVITELVRELHCSKKQAAVIERIKDK